MLESELAELMRGKRGFASRPDTIKAACLLLSGAAKSSRDACKACGVPLGSHRRIAKLAQCINAAGFYVPPLHMDATATTKFLDLFTGSGSVSTVAIEAGCEVKSLDDCSEGGITTSELECFPCLKDCVTNVTIPIINETQKITNQNKLILVLFKAVQQLQTEIDILKAK